MNKNIQASIISLATLFLLSACGGESTAENVQPDGSSANSAPIANAGINQNTASAIAVMLNGSASSDVDSDQLTYAWSITSKPTGSDITLSDTTIVNPTFTTDLDGAYVFSLIVNDGEVDSTADSVTINAATANSAPIANAGTAQNVNTTTMVTLDGSVSSDANSDQLTYAWSITSKPTGSNITLSDTTIVNPTFTTDLDGAYVFNLIVNDGEVDSTADSVTINAATANSAPTVINMPKLVANIYSIYHFLPQVHDIDNDTFLYTITNKPSWAEFNSTTGLLMGKLLQGSEGDYTEVTITASDGEESVSWAPFTITVESAVNIAHKFGEATQGGTYRSSIASYAIDNDLSTSNHTECNATDNWWQVKLPSPTDISKIVVHNRAGQTARLNGTKLYLSSDEYNGTIVESNYIETLTGSGSAQEFSYIESKRASYLLLKADAGNCLHTPEVEVYGQTPQEPRFSAGTYTLTIDKWQNKIEAIFDANATDYQSDILMYSIKEDVPFSIDNSGDIRVSGLLNDASYVFDLWVDDGINQTNQSMTIAVVDEAIVKDKYRTNDNQPTISGLLPNIYNDGDTLSVDINGTNYRVTADANDQWILDDNVISPTLAIGDYDLTLNINGVAILYEDYFEVYGSRLQKFSPSLALESINNIDVSIDSAIQIPLEKSEKVRGSSINLYVENGVTKLQNKSYREIKSLLGKYIDENNNSVFVTLTFDANILPYSENNLTSFTHDSDIAIVTTASLFDMEISFGGADCDVGTDTSVVNYCEPTKVDAQETYSDTDTGFSEQKVYSTAIATYNHLYNSIDGLNTMQAWVEQSTYKEIDYTGDYQSINGYIGDEDTFSYLYRNFIETTMPNHHVEMRSMRYKYAAEGMGGGSSASLFGDKTSGGWASSWEGAIKFDDNRLLTYDTVHHEMMHAVGKSHISGMTYGWSYALQQTIGKLYTVGENPVVNVPKYIFEKKRIDDNQIQFTFYKTVGASEDDINFEILSSTPLIDNDFKLETGINDQQNQMTLSTDETLMTRIFIRLYGSDSKEVMSDILTPADMIQTKLVEDNENNKTYHVISHGDWVKSAETMNTALEPRGAPAICAAWFGSTAWIVDEVDADRINSDFRAVIDNADWISSKKFLGRINDWWKYNAYDYSDGGYTKTWTVYDQVIADDTLGILCQTPTE